MTTVLLDQLLKKGLYISLYIRVVYPAYDKVTLFKGKVKLLKWVDNTRAPRVYPIAGYTVYLAIYIEIVVDVPT